MVLDDSLCERAWRARDPAFDGRFFIGVRSTGIYCRCVCPVRLPYRRNIEFLPSAAAAEAVGFVCVAARNPLRSVRPGKAAWPLSKEPLA